MNQINTLVIYNHYKINAKLISELKINQEINIVGETLSARLAADNVRRLQPDLIILDLSQNMMDGLRAINEGLIQDNINKVIVIIPQLDKETLLKISQFGLLSCITTNRIKEDLICAIQAVNNNLPYYSPISTQIIIREYIKTITA